MGDGEKRVFLIKTKRNSVKLRKTFSLSQTLMKVVEACG